MKPLTDEERKEMIESLTKDIEKYERLIEGEKKDVPPKMFDYLKSFVSEVMRRTDEILEEHKDITWPKGSQEYDVSRKLVETTHLYLLLGIYQAYPQRFERALMKKTKKSGS